MLRLVLIAVLLIPFGSSWAEELSPITIGWSGPLTGNSAVLGVDSLKAARIAVAEANKKGGIKGRKIVMEVEDDQYNTTQSVTAYNKLVKKNGAVAILMSTYGGPFAVSNKALSDGVLIINPLDCNSEIAAISQNTFCIATESESIGGIIAEDIIKKKLKGVGVIFDESNPFMVLVEEAFREGLQDLGGGFMFSQGVLKDNNDFRTILLRYKKRKVEGLVFFGHDPMGIAMAQARAIGITSQFYTLGTITSPGYQKLAGKSAEGSLVAYWNAPKSEKYKAFLREFASLSGRSPILELATIPTYDSTKLLIEAIRYSLTSKGTPELSLMREYLYSIRNYQGVSGILSVDPDGAVRSIQEEIFEFKGGQLVREVTAKDKN